MARYAIGDIQGCYDALLRLLKRLRFDEKKDRLLFTGDLVNRGPQSLQVLRFVKALGDSAVTVLGNHDLHLLAAAHSGKFSPKDTLEEIMRAPDRDPLLDWLRHQPLAYEEPDHGMLLVHAGLPPQWTRQQALRLAHEASDVIAGTDGEKFFRKMYGNEPDHWDEKLEGAARLRFIVNCFTRLRYCTPQGRIELRHKGAPGTQPEGLLPWFQVPGRKTAQDTIICGHWSTLGQVRWNDGKVYGLDTGCVWGGCLTALNVDTGELHKADCGQFRKPGGAQIN